MLGLEDIKKVSFRRSFLGGYKPEEVDFFIDKIQISFEQLIHEKRNLMLRIKDLEESLSRYTQEENAIKEVILNLKEVTESSLQRAEEKASEVISDANRTSDEMLMNAKKEVLVQEKICSDLKRESSNLKNKLEDIYKEHVKIISKIPDEVSEISGNQEVKVLQETITGIDSTDEEENINQPQKLQNLKFGPDYRTTDNQYQSKGIYGGIFKKDS